jgi:hypothetical protein
MLDLALAVVQLMKKKYRYSKDRSGNQYERKDVADMWNTVLKMAKKRAYIDAIITTGAAGMVFTQDLEDMEREVNERPHYEKKKEILLFQQILLSFALRLENTKENFYQKFRTIICNGA